MKHKHLDDQSRVVEHGKNHKICHWRCKQRKIPQKSQDCHFSDQYYVEDREFPQEVLNLDKRGKKTLNSLVRTIT